MRRVKFSRRRGAEHVLEVCMRQVIGMAAACALALTVGVAAQDTTKKPAAANTP